MGQVKNGKVMLDDLAGFKRHVLSLENKMVQVIVQKYKTSRSDQQNKYY